MDIARRPGDYDFAPRLGAWDVTLAAMEPWDVKLGLTQQVVYLYGGFHDADGTLYAIERKFIGPMTAGLWLMHNRNGDLEMDPGTTRSTRGEVRRHFDKDEHSYADQLMARLGPELAPAGEQPLDLRVSADGLSWGEGELMSLQGRRLGPGLQILCPRIDESFLYLSHGYHVTGSVLGSDVRGFVWLDHGYWPHGREWKEFVFFEDLQVGWEVFGNEYDDGTIEWGHLCRGRDGFTFGAILDEGGLVAAGTGLDVAMDLDDEEYVPRATFALGEDLWQWTEDPMGKLRQFSTARWGGYRAQVGHTQRVGDTRRLVEDFTWLECFSQRIRDEEVPPVA